MYALIDVVGAAEDRAETTALADRLRYRPFLEEAERFAAAKGLVVCGDAATRLLLGDSGDPAAPPPVAFDSFQCDFFSDRPVPDARALGDAVYAVAPQGLGHYTTVRTKIADRLLVVSVDGRDLLGVVALPALGGAALRAVIPFAERPAQFAKGPDGRPLRLRVVGPELQLATVFGALCDPSRAGGWPALLAVEAALRARLWEAASPGEPRPPGGRPAAEDREGEAAGGRNASALPCATGGRAGGRRRSRRGDSPGRPPEPRAAAQMRKALLAEYVADPGRVLVGALAVALLAGRPPSERRLQVVAAGPLEAEGAELARLAAGAGVEAEWRLEDPHFPAEPRLRRLTLFVISHRREPVLDVYNAAAFDLVPVGPDEALDRKAEPDLQASPRVGTPFVLMRFLLVDLWVIRLLRHLGAVAAPFAEEVRARVLGDFAATEEVYAAALALAAEDTEAAARRLIPLDAYVGALDDAETAAKRGSAPQFYAHYMPAAGDRKARTGGQVAPAAPSEMLAAGFVADDEASEFADARELS